MITPTVGRIVWFYPDGSNEHTQPLAAIIAAVWGERCVNLCVIGDNGVPQSHPRTSVQLLQEGDATPKQQSGAIAGHCRWMPYQQAQAAAQCK